MCRNVSIFYEFPNRFDTFVEMRCAFLNGSEFNSIHHNVIPTSPFLMHKNGSLSLFSKFDWIREMFFKAFFHFFGSVAPLLHSYRIFKCFMFKSALSKFFLLQGLWIKKSILCDLNLFFSRSWCIPSFDKMSSLVLYHILIMLISVRGHFRSFSAKLITDLWLFPFIGCPNFYFRLIAVPRFVVFASGAYSFIANIPSHGVRAILNSLINPMIMLPNFHFFQHSLFPFESFFRTKKRLSNFNNIRFTMIIPHLRYNLARCEICFPQIGRMGNLLNIFRFNTVIPFIQMRPSNQVCIRGV